MPRTQIKDFNVKELMSILPANTTMGDVHETLGRFDDHDELTRDELIVEINKATEERLHREADLRLPYAG